ncbi:Holliday junction DNA helicase subunit RuvA [Anaerobranca californiensis DSM 14826]|jgi:Holliday junction DNA helicase RuvA|uniref:Holliday junction branch migration complex subunit RuvA n=1 Tax=Anaerobranca californiensis DSM 14826 TaxID=1120989 RepID=A0A1M6LPL4_9FIRM|nr:Holliday junction branch migration protein RuvA [Anaerobranca californiensis]SHJ73134.1 Holliday junction DNA helicase subunit RuvA [Anaerobranca californiensis DSM 14826]
MIAFVRGILLEIEGDSVIIDCGGLGYRIYTPVTSLVQQIGEEILLHTYQLVREDDISLYGFIDKQQLNIFKKCISVSGIGPKSALGILNGLKLEQIFHGIHREDYTIFTKISGIGKKTAQRLVLELKDKIKIELENLQNFETSKGVGEEQNKVNHLLSDKVIEALLSLGYKRKEVEDSVKRVISLGERDISVIIKEVLKEKGLGR